ncbi:jg26338, partial [Pararge aegeria aegeria]
KFGWSDALANKEYFHKIPRTLVQAESEGWRRTERPKGPLEELRLYCSPGKYVCPLYDPSGFVAGIQLAIPTVVSSSHFLAGGHRLATFTKASESGTR